MRARRLCRTLLVYSLFLYALSSLAQNEPTFAKDAEMQAPERSMASAEEKRLLNGFRRYQGTCGHCHGPDGVGGSFAPSLIENPMPFAGFKTIVENGSVTGTSVMKGFANDPNVMDHIDDIYAYLSARSEGRIGRGRPTF